MSTTNTPFEDELDKILALFKYGMDFDNPRFLQRDHVHAWTKEIAQLHEAAIVAELESLIPEPVAEMASMDYRDELARMCDDIRDRIAALQKEVKEIK